MNRKSVGALLLAAAALTPACKKEEAKPAPTSEASPATDEEKTLYALGAMVGQRFVGPMHPSDREPTTRKRPRPSATPRRRKRERSATRRASSTRP